MTAWAEEAAREGGLVILALLILLENLFPPIPSEAILPLAGAQVAAGTMSYPAGVFAATCGSVAGALVLYALARFGGRALLLRHGRLLRLKAHQLDRADEWFDQRGAWIVFLGRLVPGIRSLVSIPAGLSEMPVWRFVALTTLGSALWNAALIGAGWALGSRWREATALVERFDVVLLAAAAGALIAAAVVLVRRRRRRVVEQVR